MEPRRTGHRDPRDLENARVVYAAERAAYDDLIATRRMVLGSNGTELSEGGERLRAAGERWIAAARAAYAHDCAPERFVQAGEQTQRVCK